MHVSDYLNIIMTGKRIKARDRHMLIKLIRAICICVFTYGVAASANAALVFEIERVSDTVANITATGTLGSTYGDSPDTISFLNPFNVEPIGFDNRSVFSSSTMLVGSDPILSSYVMGPSYIPADGTPAIYLNSSYLLTSFTAGSTVSGALEWVLPSDLSLASIGSSGVVTWGTASSGVNTGTWTVVPASVVPVPAAVWLFGSGLIGLIGLARRKKAA